MVFEVEVIQLVLLSETLGKEPEASFLDGFPAEFQAGTWHISHGT